MSPSLSLSSHLAKRLVRAAALSGNSIDEEVRVRLEQSLQSIASGPTLPLDLERRIERSEAAARAFASAMQIAERMKLGDRQALRFAADYAKRMTGVDWEKEVQTIPPEVATAPCRPAVLDFLRAWESGSLGLPWSPALSVDVHSVYRRWAVKRGLRPTYIAQFVPALVACGCVSTARKRWRHRGLLNGPSMMLIPKADANRPGPLTDWLGDCISAFQKAAADVGVAP